MKVAMSTLGEKNSYCYFLLGGLWELGFWPPVATEPVPKPLILSRTVKKLGIRLSLQSQHPQVSCAQPVSGDRLELQWPCWSWVRGCDLQDADEGAADGCPFTLEQSTTCSFLLLCQWNMHARGGKVGFDVYLIQVP